MGNRYNDLRCMKCQGAVLDEHDRPCPNNCGKNHPTLECPACGFVFPLPAICAPRPLSPELLNDEDKTYLEKSRN